MFVKLPTNGDFMVNLVMFSYLDFKILGIDRF